MSDGQTIPIRHLDCPRISVVVPAFNRASLISDTLESIDRQSIAPLVETIVVDDGSTDATREVVLSRRQGPGGLLLIATPNRGASAARNTGFAAVRSPYVTFLDSDDLVDNEKFERQLSVLEETSGAAYVTCDWAIFEGERNRIVRSLESPDAAVWPILPYFLQGQCFPNGCALYRREACAKAGPWPERLRTFEDWAWHVSMGAIGVVGRHIPQRMLFVRRHAGPRLSEDSARPQLVADYATFVQHAIRRLRRRGKTWTDFGPAACGLLYRAGVWHLRVGAARRGLSLLSRASRLHPRLGSRVGLSLLASAICAVGPASAIRLFDRLKGRGGSAPAAGF